MGPISLGHGIYVETNTPTGSRTPVFGLRIRCPRPLDDGGVTEVPDRTGHDMTFQACMPNAPEGIILRRSEAETAAAVEADGQSEMNEPVQA